MKRFPCPPFRMCGAARVLNLVAFAGLACSDAVKTASFRADAFAGGSPVLKAVEMLEDLEKKVIGAAKTEEESYWKYTMWCQNESQATQWQITSNEQAKEMLTADIAKATASISSAALHLADIAQYESTDEADLKAATLLREKEASDFKALELELVEGIRTTQAAQTKLEQDILASGGKVAKKGAFLQTEKRPSKAMEAFSDVMVELTNAAALSAVEDMKQYPSLLEQAEAEQSALAQRRVNSQLGISTEPKKDASISTLQENLQLLRDVEAKSQSSLDAARAKEKRHAADFLKLKNALEGKIRAVKQDLERTKKELADARARKAKAEGELAVAEQDIKTGKQYLLQVERGCMEKAAQFQQQKKNRQDEVKAVQAALKALRGIMDTSAAKQGLFSFLQMSSSSSRSKAAGQTVATLALKRVQQLAVSLKSTVLDKLASKMRVVSRYGGGGDVFGKMRKLIQEMIDTLEQKNRDETGKKAFCDQEMKHTKTALDEREDEAKRKKAAVELASSQVAQLRQELATLADELGQIAASDQELTKMREAEHEEHVKAYKDLQLGVAGVQAAIKALRDYYSQDRQPVSVDMAASMALAAEGRAPRLAEVEASTAGAGVISLLEVVESNFARNMADLQSQDRNAQENYDQMIHESQVLKAQKNADVKHKTTEATNLERSVTELRSDSASAQQQFEAVTEYLAKLKDECTAKVETREERIARRAKEMEGLQEALSILEAR
mmetsp:Transcript_98598/g.234877  ORF Transcript_98598/g.234877 Transcript_98598/m.234877 type:complete len:731 (+) Transcript_98598:27-2219(+)